MIAKENIDINKISLGDTEIAKVSLGDIEVFRSTVVVDLSSPTLWEQGGFRASNGAPISGTDRIRVKGYIQIEGTKVKMSANAPYTVNAAYYKADNTLVAFGARAREITENVPATATKIKISIGKDGNANITLSELANANIKLEFTD